MTEYPADTVVELLQRGVADRPAIGAPGRAWLTHQGLRDLVQRTIGDLDRHGYRTQRPRCDRVAERARDGDGVRGDRGGQRTTAPLNPAYKTEEFEFYLSDLNAKALVIQQGMESPSRAVAGAHGIPIIELIPVADAAAGAFTLKPQTALAGTPQQGGAAGAQDIALVLHTSGTTSRPKIVPLRHINITATAYHIVETLRLTTDDICLNIMPLFHIHGLMAATLSSLAAGASVCRSPGFNAFRFFSWFAEVRPTWYTAVPTMHQAILNLAGRNEAAIKAGRLRFIRSSSSSLPPQVMEAMQQTFGVPVIEAYGMTEAAHQMASNPLPPQRRYPGSVGSPVGTRRSRSWTAWRFATAGRVG